MSCPTNLSGIGNKCMEKKDFEAAGMDIIVCLLFNSFSLKLIFEIPFSVKHADDALAIAITQMTIKLMKAEGLVYIGRVNVGILMSKIIAKIYCCHFNFFWILGSQMHSR